MATLSQLKEVLCGKAGDQGVIQDTSYYDGITDRINDAVQAIAAGIKIPDGRITPPLPELYTNDTVTTSTSNPYVSLPSDYQRHVFMVADWNGDILLPPNGGDYYAFTRFIRQVRKKSLDQAGTIEVVCVRGSRLYYQDIPSSAKELTVHYYSVPDTLSDATDVPTCIPFHLQKSLIKHYVCREVFQEKEDGEGPKPNFNHHTLMLYEKLTDLIDFVGEDAGAEYYGYDNDGWGV